MRAGSAQSTSLRDADRTLPMLSTHAERDRRCVPRCTQVRNRSPPARSSPTNSKLEGIGPPRPK